MANMLRKLISRLNGQVMSRMSAARRDLEVPINISIELERKTGSLLGNIEKLAIGGETKDLSETGIAFYVDSIRLREHYLVGQNRILNARLDLPNGSVRMQIIGQRYEQIDMHSSHSKYLIGASIVEMNALDKEVYGEFLRLGKNAFKNKAPNFQTGTSS